MTTVYSQLRVSCGLSATINSFQPETFKATITQSLGHWLDIQWHRLTHNNDPDDPLVKLCGERREFKWVAVLDYILLRKIQSSFLVCQGVPSGVLVLEVEEADLNWNMLTPAFLKIFKKLNERKEDWPLWHYDGEVKDPETQLKDPEIRRMAVKLVQSIKVFYEIFSSNISAGPEGEWKNIFMNMVGFPETLTHQHVVFHIDHYKTDFELAGLLQTLGYELDNTSGRGYPKNVVPNSIVLINRPEHWVCEDTRARGTVLDSLTQGTDSIHTIDSFNYYKPIQNLRVMRKYLPELEKLFPDVEVTIETEDLTEFPELELPETTTPEATAQQYHHKAAASYLEGNYKDALLDKRIEVALLEKLPPTQSYYQNLVEFTEWCIQRDKNITAQENFTKMMEAEPKIQNLSPQLKGKAYKLEANLHFLQDNPKNAANALKKALDIYENAKNHEEAYEIANSLGVAMSRAKNNEEAIASFQRALKLSQTAQQSVKPVDGKTPQKYWPALVKAIERKIKYLEKLPKEGSKTPPTTENAVKKVE